MHLSLSLCFPSLLSPFAVSWWPIPAFVGFIGAAVAAAGDDRYLRSL